MIVEVLQVLYFFVPAYLGNMVPVFVRKLPWLRQPLDCGLSWRGHRVFGDHKTWRGLLFGTVTGVLVFYGQQLLHTNGFTSWSVIDYGSVSVLLGGLIAAGALLGDAVESFFKRRRGIGPGQMWFFWDQVDFMLGSMFVTVPYWAPRWWPALVALLIVFVLNIGFQKLGYYLRLKDDPL